MSSVQALVLGSPSRSTNENYIFQEKLSRRRVKPEAEFEGMKVTGVRCPCCEAYSVGEVRWRLRLPASDGRW